MITRRWKPPWGHVKKYDTSCNYLSSLSVVSVPIPCLWCVFRLSVSVTEMNWSVRHLVPYGLTEPCRSFQNFLQFNCETNQQRMPDRAPSVFECPVTREPFQVAGQGTPILLSCGHSVSRAGLVTLCTRFVLEGRDSLSTTPLHGAARGSGKDDEMFYTLDCPRCRQPTRLSQTWLKELQVIQQSHDENNLA